MTPFLCGLIGTALIFAGFTGFAKLQKWYDRADLSSWQWASVWGSLVRVIGFLASFILMFAGVLTWVSGVTP